jgi:hypothetical protein
VRVIVTTGPAGRATPRRASSRQSSRRTSASRSTSRTCRAAAATSPWRPTARAAPDGYTILAATSNIVTNISLYPKISYDPYKDFDPISLMCSSPHVLVVHRRFPAATVSELVALAKASPWKFSYASAGRGTPAHLAGELFKLAFAVDITHVPFNGGGRRPRPRSRPRADRGVGVADGGDLYPRRPAPRASACSAANAPPPCRTFPA